MTLDAGGNPDAVFIFQTDTAITTGSNSVVVLANGAKAKNVWWIAGSAATLGVSSTFKEPSLPMVQRSLCLTAQAA